jgi:hypothetical protein
MHPQENAAVGTAHRELVCTASTSRSSMPRLTRACRRPPTAYAPTSLRLPAAPEARRSASKRVHARLIRRLHVVQPTIGHHGDVGVLMWRGAI